MHEATRTLSYDGVFVYQRGDRLESMRLIHRYADDVESERLISLSGPAREVIRKGSDVTCLSADDGGAAPDKNPPRDIIGIASPPSCSSPASRASPSVGAPTRTATTMTRATKAARRRTGRRHGCRPASNSRKAVCSTWKTNAGRSVTWCIPTGWRWCRCSSRPSTMKSARCAASHRAAR
ncbi:MAG: hypothetical protein IPG43_06855 [Proteobacteria bacterium]|nr:hypothetical protein [Pseudomonadota bacterium]